MEMIAKPIVWEPDENMFCPACGRRTVEAEIGFNHHRRCVSCGADWIFDMFPDTGRDF